MLRQESRVSQKWQILNAKVNCELFILERRFPHSSHDKFIQAFYIIT